MYLGGDSRDRRSQLHNLEFVLYGYGFAMKVHGLKGPGHGLVREFAEYLHKRFGWPPELGPASAVVDGVGPNEDFWERFWELIVEFGQQRVGTTSVSE